MMCTLEMCLRALAVDVSGLVFPPGMPNVEVGSFMWKDILKISYGYV